MHHRITTLSLVFFVNILFGGQEPPVPGMNNNRINNTRCWGAGATNKTEKLGQYENNPEIGHLVHVGYNPQCCVLCANGVPHEKNKVNIKEPKRIDFEDLFDQLSDCEIHFGSQAPTNLSLYNERICTLMDDVVISLYFSRRSNNIYTQKISENSLIFFCKKKSTSARDICSLIALGCNVNHQDERGYTPLMIACEYNPLLVPVLLARGADDCLRNLDNLTAFDIACQNYNFTEALMLIPVTEIGESEIEYRDQLFLQACKENSDWLGRYISKDFVNIQDEDGRTPLMFAAMHKNVILFNWLMRYQVHLDKVDRNGWTALMFACQSNATKIIDRLLATNQVDSELQSALVVAVLNNNNSLARRLAQYIAGI